jgi:hypothetical protein
MATGSTVVRDGDAQKTVRFHLPIVEVLRETIGVTLNGSEPFAQSGSFRVSFQ